MTLNTKGRHHYPGKRPDKTSRNERYYNVKTPLNQHEAYDSFQAFLLDNGGADCQVIADGEKHRIGTADKPKCKDFTYCLFPDLRGGWIQNFRNGNGVVKWRFQSGLRWNPTPAERKAIAESRRRWQIKQDLKLWVVQERRRVGLLIYKFNRIVVRAVESLESDSNDHRAWFALSICYRCLPRLEYQHDMLLSKDPADWVEVFRHSRASGKTERRAA